MRKLLTCLVVLSATSLAGCATPTHAIRVGVDSINPTLADAGGPLPILADTGPARSRSRASGNRNSNRTGNGGRSSRPAAVAQGTGNRAGRSVVATGASGRVTSIPPSMVTTPSATAFQDAPRISMVPASGDQRSRLVRSAKRLVGIRNSFNSRSFLGHLLAICDILPTGQSSVAWTSVDQMGLARDAGSFRGPDGVPGPGDVVYYRCPSGCGADAKDGVGVGVIVDVLSDKTSVVAYRNGEVGTFRLDAGFELIGYSAP